MILTLSTTHNPATDLGFLLHKHPNRFQSFELSFGKAHVFYTDAQSDLCRVCLLLDVDPVGLARKRSRSAFSALTNYVNDRPFVASSFMSTAIAQVFGSALAGRCKDRPELAETEIPLHVGIDVLPVRGGEEFLRKIFEPLGYEVGADRHCLDERFPEWGESQYFSVSLSAKKTISQLLRHLFVLIPVFDNQKHYFVDRHEMDKLLNKGEGWLADHPGKNSIVKRYLRFRPSLVNPTLAQLVGDENEREVDTQSIENQLEKPIRLNDQRVNAVIGALKSSGATRVADLGCGEGKLLKALLNETQFQEILGMDVSIKALEIAHRRLKFDQLPDSQTRRIKLIQGSLMYRDQRLDNFEAASVVEVIEHLDPARLAAFERVVFGEAKPGTVVLTTPNKEYNVMWESMAKDGFRHSDHRFEWSRIEFQNWTNAICSRFGYSVSILPIGPVDSQVGSPTQMGVFCRE